ncbi:MAG: PfkB family carbohydrate kinase [Oscillospiraceae bacterium]|nr:PfkB family carbohydrate kinase [Oscillospiraceae bacterium]
MEEAKKEHFDLVAIGEILVAMLEIGKNEQGNSIFAANPGEGPGGVAAAAARLGARSAYIAKVGNDPLGQSLYEMLRWSGVDVSHVTFDPDEPTTLALIPSEESGGQSAYVRCPGADVRISEAELSRDLIESASVFHFGSESLYDEPARSATLSAVRIAREAGVLVSFAPGCRVSQCKKPETELETIRNAIRLCDILSVKNEEMEQLTGTSNLEEGSAKLLAEGPFLVMITMGNNGVFYRKGECTGYQPVVKRVENYYTGAISETFLGAFLTRLIETGAPREVKKETLDDILGFAIAAGALTASRPGTIRAMPQREEVRRSLQDLQN